MKIKKGIRLKLTEESQNLRDYICKNVVNVPESAVIVYLCYDIGGFSYASDDLVFYAHISQAKYKELVRNFKMNDVKFGIV